MKSILPLISSVVAAGILTGCSNLMVPKTQISGSINGEPFMISSPKDSELTNLVITVNSNKETTVKIGGLKAKMNPDVITMSGEAFVNSLNAAASAAGQFTGKAASAAAKP